MFLGDERMAGQDCKEDVYTNCSRVIQLSSKDIPSLKNGGWMTILSRFGFGLFSG